MNISSPAVIRILFIGAGLLFIYGGAAAPGWFMERRRPRQLASFFGRNGARAVYVAAGIGVICFGFFSSM